MIDYILSFADEAAAIAACPDLGRYNDEGAWRWCPTGVLAGLTLKRQDGTDLPGFILSVSRPEPDGDLAARATMELSRELIRDADSLADCVTFSKPGLMNTNPVVVISPVMMGADYPTL